MCGEFICVFWNIVGAITVWLSFCGIFKIKTIKTIKGTLSQSGECIKTGKNLNLDWIYKTKVMWWGSI